MSQDTTLPPSGQFRKKPVVIDAWRIDFQNKPLPEWVNDAFRSETIDWCPAGEGLYINTLEGLMKGGFGDYLIRGVKCELYACKADIFEATYEWAAIAAQAQPPSSTDALRKMLNAANETDSSRWEIGFRNIVAILYGPKHKFEIADVVERVRQQAQGVPEIDGAKLVADCYRVTKQARGTKGCLQFRLGAEWFREQMLAAAPQAEPQPVHRRHTDVEALSCADRLNRSFPPSSLKDEAADHIRELVATKAEPQTQATAVAQVLSEHLYPLRVCVKLLESREKSTDRPSDYARRSVSEAHKALCALESMNVYQPPAQHNAEPQPEREPLTEGEINEACSGIYEIEHGVYYDDAIARATEQACANKWGIKLAGIGTKGGDKP